MRVPESRSFQLRRSGANRLGGSWFISFEILLSASPVAQFGSLGPIRNIRR
jgi:hypothetical protein